MSCYTRLARLDNLGAYSVPPARATVTVVLRLFGQVVVYSTGGRPLPSRARHGLVPAEHGQRCRGVVEAHHGHRAPGVCRGNRRPDDSRAVGGMSAMSGVNTTVPGLLAGPSVTVALTQRPVASLTA